MKRVTYYERLRKRLHKIVDEYVDEAEGSEDEICEQDGIMLRISDLTTYVACNDAIVDKV